MNADQEPAAPAPDVTWPDASAPRSHPDLANVEVADDSAALTLTVCGSAGSHPGVGRACSGYLVESGGTRLLLDAGNGATANVQRHIALAEVDAVVISHRHVDHCIDLIGMFYALRFDPDFTGRIPLYTPAEVVETLTSLLSVDSAMAFADVFNHHLVTGGDTATIGPMRLSFANANHPPPSVAVRIDAGATLVYTGDTGASAEVARLAFGADLLLAEATWHGRLDDYPADLHLTGAAAASMARDAGVGKLLLTHIAGGADRDRVYEEATAVFAGPTALAEDGQIFRL